MVIIIKTLIDRPTQGSRERVIKNPERETQTGKNLDEIERRKKMKKRPSP